MRRRQYLASTCIALSIAVAGCNDNGDGESNGDDASPNGDDTPTEEPNGDETPANGDEDESEALASFRDAIEASGYEIASLDVEDDIVVVEYYSDATDDEAVREEISDVAPAFADGIDDGWEVEWLEVWLLDRDGDRAYGSYTVYAGWAAEWTAGERSDDEFFDRVLETY